MNFAKLNPWNWLKKEDEAGKPEPAGKAPGRDLAAFGSENQFAAMRQLMDSFFKDFAIPKEFSPGFASMLRPKLDISGHAEGYQISVEAPGVEEKDITLELHGDTLILKGEKKREEKREDKGYYREERSYGSFQRILTLPEDAAPAGIKASFKNGVLNIEIPRNKEKLASAKRIEIDAS